MATLKIHSQEEHGDLVEWATEHPGDDYTQQQRHELQAWLSGCMPRAALWAHVRVPVSLVGILDALLDDWSEVLGAHGEDLQTTLEA